MTTSMRTPLSRVRGHGSAKTGTGHFIASRVTGLALMLLTAYLAVNAALTLEPSFDGARAWLAEPPIAVPLFLAMMIGLYHMQMGMQEIVEDYIAKPATKLTLMVLNSFFCLALAAAGGLTILKLSLGA